jgi:hypothetical protein
MDYCYQAFGPSSVSVRPDRGSAKRVARVRKVLLATHQGFMNVMVLRRHVLDGYDNLPFWRRAPHVCHTASGEDEKKKTQRQWNTRLNTANMPSSALWYLLGYASTVFGSRAGGRGRSHHQTGLADDGSNCRRIQKFFCLYLSATRCMWMAVERARVSGPRWYLIYCLALLLGFCLHQSCDNYYLSNYLRVGRDGCCSGVIRIVCLINLPPLASELHVQLDVGGCLVHLDASS